MINQVITILNKYRTPHQRFGLCLKQTILANVGVGYFTIHDYRPLDARVNLMVLSNCAKVTTFIKVRLDCLYDCGTRPNL